MPTVTMTLRECGRCGNEHPDMAFRELARPIKLLRRQEGTFVLILTHWATCPMTEEPVLLRFSGEEQAG
jgi:hypothetical protein